MAPDPNAFHGSYTSLAQDCRHIVHHSEPSALELKLSRPAATYSDPPDWEDEHPPANFVCVSTNILLCPTCEAAIRGERFQAGQAYAAIWVEGGGKGEWDDDGFMMQKPEAVERREAAAEYYWATTLRVAKFDARVAARTNTFKQAEAKAARERKWEARKKVAFAVEEGEGPGEKEVVKEKKSPILLGPPTDSAVSLPELE